MRTTSGPATFSPNQQAKRREIIEAAMALLVRDGLAACTARALAEESSFSRSAIHYYLGSMEEVVDTAMAGHLREFIDHLRAVGDRHTDPADRFWAMTEAHVDVFARRRGLALLWFDYSIASVQQGRTGAVTRIETALRETLGELLRACAVPDVEARSDAVVGYLIGTTLRGVLHPIPWPDIRAQLALISAVPSDR